jgi:hypothetical protein
VESDLEAAPDVRGSVRVWESPYIRTAMRKTRLEHRIHKGIRSCKYNETMETRHLRLCTKPYLCNPRPDYRLRLPEVSPSSKAR